MNRLRAKLIIGILLGTLLLVHLNFDLLVLGMEFSAKRELDISYNLLSSLQTKDDVQRRIEIVFLNVLMEGDYNGILFFLGSKRVTISGINNIGFSPLRKYLTHYIYEEFPPIKASVVKLLLQFGADPNEQSTADKWSPLEMVANRLDFDPVRDEPIMVLLIDHGADGFLKMSSGNSFYVHALSRGWIKVADAISMKSHGLHTGSATLFLIDGYKR